MYIKGLFPEHRPVGIGIRNYVNILLGNENALIVDHSDRVSSDPVKEDFEGKRGPVRFNRYLLAVIR
jgi:hypothetical protein